MLRLEILHPKYNLWEFVRAKEGERKNITGLWQKSS